MRDYTTSLTKIKVKERPVVRKDIDVNEHEWLSNITLKYKVKERPVVRKDMDVNEHDYPTLHLDTKSSKGTACSKKGYGCKWTWLSNITLRHKIK